MRDLQEPLQEPVPGQSGIFVVTIDYQETFVSSQPKTRDIRDQSYQCTVTVVIASKQRQGGCSTVQVYTGNLCQADLICSRELGNSPV